MSVERSFVLQLKLNSTQASRKYTELADLSKYTLLTYSRGHASFSQSTEEIKPLTPEEVKAKLEELKKAAAERKAAQVVKDKEEEKKNMVCYTHLGFAQNLNNKGSSE